MTNINTQQLAWRRPKLESHPTVEKLFDLVIEEGETAKEANHWHQYRYSYEQKDNDNDK
jgi:hypothetical protein